MDLRRANSAVSVSQVVRWEFVSSGETSSWRIWSEQPLTYTCVRSHHRGGCFFTFRSDPAVPRCIAASPSSTMSDAPEAAPPSPPTLTNPAPPEVTNPTKPGRYTTTSESFSRFTSLPFSSQFSTNNTRDTLFFFFFMSTWYSDQIGSRSGSISAWWLYNCFLPVPPSCSGVYIQFC